jgi:hypothetical protein
MNGRQQMMANRKVVSIKSTDPLAKRLKSGTVIAMGDGWKGRVHHDDGKAVSLIRDGERVNDAFKGHRGFLRRSVKIGGFQMVGRSQVVDLAARKMLPCSVTVIDRDRLETEWQSAPGYN